MPRDALQQARRDRNAALLDAMVLAATADGKVAGVELRQLMERVLERPEFEGLTPDEVAHLVEASAKRLAAARDMEDILHALRERLPDHRNRLLAFGLATAVALADNKATRDELGLLKLLQAGFNLTEAEVTKVFESLQAGHSLAEVLGEPTERLYAETMVLVSAADGAVHESELAAMLENFAGDPAFHQVPLEQAQKYLRDALADLTTEGLPARLTALARGLSTHGQRTKAFRLGVRVAYADGKPSPAELRTLELLQATFGLKDDEVARITVEA
jgi:tellurite resistance protein